MTDSTNSITPDDDMAATQPDAAVDAVTATLDSTEPVPAAETTQAPHMLGELEAPVVLVLGLGESSPAMACRCVRHDARVCVADTYEAPTDLPILYARVLNAEPVSDPFALPLLGGMALVAISPGLSSLDPSAVVLLNVTNAQSVSVRGEIGLLAHALVGLKAAQGYAPHVLTITGTNRKTTTTALTGILIQYSSKAVGATGSISPSTLDKLGERVDTGTLPGVWVLELSSFQFGTMRTLDADAAIILDIVQDHLDQHGTLEAYVAVKGRIFSANTMRVLNCQDAGVMAFVSKNGDDITFGTGEPGTPDALGLLRGGGMPWIVPAKTEQGELPRPTCRKKGDNAPAVTVPVRLKRLVPADALHIRGLRNAASAVAVLTSCRVIGLPTSALLHGLCDHVGEPHHVELTATFDGIGFFDDNKGTDVSATVAVLLGLSKHVVLIVGGDGKGQGFSPLAEPVVQCTRAVILIGHDVLPTHKTLANTGVTLINALTLRAAVQEAVAHAQPGGAVLLSSACTSLDVFHSYKHRAQMFHGAVVALAANRGVLL